MDTQDPKEGVDTLSESALISQEVIPYLLTLGYRFLQSEVRVPVAGRILSVDLVVYADETKAVPHLIVEVKRNLPDEVTLLDDPVQRAFAAAVALGQQTRYLLITDGTKHYWFERTNSGRSLVELSTPPGTIEGNVPTTQDTLSLIPITDPDDFYKLLRQINYVFRSEPKLWGLRRFIELNQILIAKLHDEQVLLGGGLRRFRTDNQSAARVSQRVKELYFEAVNELGGNSRLFEDPPKSSAWVLEAVRILEPYMLSTVTPIVRGRFFWQTLTGFTRLSDGQFTTPEPLAKLLLELASPRIGDNILDLACGTGLFLLEAVAYLEELVTNEHMTPQRFVEQQQLIKQRVTGIDWNLEVAELAATMLALNDISPNQIIRANSLDGKDLDSAGIKPEHYDVVLLDPPIGALVTDQNILSQYDIARLTRRPTVEALFIERAIKLLRPNGKLAIFVPDSFLFSSANMTAREWLLKNTQLRAVISLPSDTFSPIGHSGKASVLLLEKDQFDDQRDAIVLIANVQNIGYDRLGRPTPENDIPKLLNVIRKFQETGQVDEIKDGLHIWSVSSKDLNAQSLDIARLNPTQERLVDAVRNSQYPVKRLDELVQLISGRTIQERVAAGSDSPILIQAGMVRDLELVIDLTTAPRISQASYNNSERIQLRWGDVLVTTTGLYLGRAAVIDDLSTPAIASGALTILRSVHPEIVDPFFLAATINSEIGRIQIAQRQAPTTAQPYIKRTDLGSILIPLPDPTTQQDISKRIRDVLAEAKSLATRAQELESGAKSLIVSKLLKGDDNE